LNVFWEGLLGLCWFCHLVSIFKRTDQTLEFSCKCHGNLSLFRQKNSPIRKTINTSSFQWRKSQWQSLFTNLLYFITRGKGYKVRNYKDRIGWRVQSLNFFELFSILSEHVFSNNHFNAVLMGLVSRINIILLLKIHSRKSIIFYT
jgi:hypothetical protein